MVGQLYLVVLSEKPTKEESDVGSLSEFIAGEYVIANSDVEAAIAVVLGHDGLTAKVDKARLEVTVYPFH